MRRILRWWLAAAVCAARAMALEEDFSGGIVDRAEALAAARTVTTEKYPDAKQAVISEIQRVRYAPDGTYVQWHEQYLKMLTEDGRRENLMVSTQFTIPYQRGPEDCKITVVEIIKPDGKAIKIDVATQSRIVIDSSDMDKNIYNPNDKVIQVNVAGLEVGDVLHTVMFDRIVQPRARDSWGDWIVLEGPVPILRSVEEIYAPRERPLAKVALKSEVPGTVKYTVTDTPEGKLHRWEARNVPQMFEEPEMPPFYTVVQRVLVSTQPDWETVSRWYWNLSKPHYEVGPEIRQKVKELTDGAKDRRERIASIFRFVSQEIRYMGIMLESTAPGYEPHDVKSTFAARHGVCRDKAALLVAMLREAGEESYPVLIHVGPKKDPEVPLPYFNHAIVCVKEPDGSDQLMDPTDENTRDLLPGYLRGKSYLVASIKGDPLRTSPVEPAAANMVNITTSARLAGGRLTASTEFRFGGVNDNIYRRKLARDKPEEQRLYFDSVAESAAPGARIKDLVITPTNIMDVTTPLSVRIDYEADSPAIAGGTNTMLPLPLFGARIGAANIMLRYAGLKERRFPLLTDMTCGVHESLALEVEDSPGRIADLPDGKTVSEGPVRWVFAVTQTGSTVRAESDFRLETVEFSPDEYRQLKDIVRLTERAGREMALYSGSAASQDPGADALTLAERVEFRLDDAHRWTETRSVSRQILTYGGKKDYAEVKIGFNSGWESVRLDRGTTRGPDGATQTVSPKETNLMDAPWAGAAPRYPVEKLLVVSLPAVEVGSIVEYQYTRSCSNRPFFAEWESFRSFEPIRSKTVVLDAPEGLVRVDTARLSLCGVTCVTNRAAGRVRLEWQARDVRPVRKEEGLPPWWTFNPTVFLSCGDWADYAKKVEKQLSRAAADSKAASAEARRLTKEAKTREDALRAIRDFVATRTRGTPPGLAGMPLECLGSADGTLRDGYGNSADRAALLYSMLKATGFRPRFVVGSGIPWVAELTARAERSPLAGMFGDVMVRVPAKSAGMTGDGWVYLNDTDQYALLGATPHANRAALLLPEGTIEEILPLRDTRRDVEYRMAVGADGVTTITRLQLVYGAQFGGEKKRFDEMTPELKRRYYQELLSALSQSAEPVGDLKVDFSGYPGRIEFTARVADYAIAADPFLYLQLPEWGGGVFGARTDTRANPLFFADKSSRLLTVRVEYPATYGVKYLPPLLDARNVAGTSSFVHAAVTADAAGRSIQAIFDTELAPGTVEESRYQELLRFDESFSHRGTRTLLLEKK